MHADSQKRKDQHHSSADERQPDRNGVEDIPGNARDREMGRGGEPLGDRGQGRETWVPPPGEQGISNRPADDDETAADEEDEDDDFEDDDEDEEEDGDDEKATEEE
jgi:hypothetical protein